MTQLEKAVNLIHLILDQIDYTTGACRVNEMVGAVLPREILDQAHDFLRNVKPIVNDDRRLQ